MWYLVRGPLPVESRPDSASAVRHGAGGKPLSTRTSIAPYSILVKWKTLILSRPLFGGGPLPFPLYVVRNGLRWWLRLCIPDPFISLPG